MARSWSELLGEADARRESRRGARGLFGRLRESLGKSRRALTEQIAVAAFDPGDDASWERLEEALIYADVGVRATAELIRRLEARQDLTELGEALAEEIAALFGEPPTLDVAARACGDARRRRQRHRQDDDDRQAREQAARARAHGDARRRRHVPRRGRGAARDLGASAPAPAFVGGERGGDPAAVAYDAVGAGTDVVIVDTAGRLHTQTNLMDELAKVRRVIAGRREGAPHEVLLVVDATTGQNGLQQARLFSEAVGVTGVALTKLDGSAKGGIAVAIAYELGLPVKLVGVGEGLDDLRPFDAGDFARALVAE